MAVAADGRRIALEAIRQFSIEVERAAPDRVHTVRYGLDPASVQAPPGARDALCAALDLPPSALIAGSVCRLIEQKGLSYALRGFAPVAAQIPQAHYVIVGDGPLRGDLEAEARALGLAGRVHFLGWREDARAVMAALDLLLLLAVGRIRLGVLERWRGVRARSQSAIRNVNDSETGWPGPPTIPGIRRRC